MKDEHLILAPYDYEPMLREIEAGNVRDYALTALRILNPDFAAWLDARAANPINPQKDSRDA